MKAKALFLLGLILASGCKTSIPKAKVDRASFNPPPSSQVLAPAPAPTKTNDLRITSQSYKNGIWTMTWEGGNPPYMVEWSNDYRQAATAGAVQWVCLEETTNTSFTVGIGGYPLSFFRIENETTNVVDATARARLIRKPPPPVEFPPLPPP